MQFSSLFNDFYSECNQPLILNLPNKDEEFPNLWRHCTQSFHQRQSIQQQITGSVPVCEINWWLFYVTHENSTSKARHTLKKAFERENRFVRPWAIMCLIWPIHILDIYKLPGQVGTDLNHRFSSSLHCPLVRPDRVKLTGGISKNDSGCIGMMVIMPNKNSSSFPYFSHTYWNRELNANISHPCFSRPSAPPWDSVTVCPLLGHLSFLEKWWFPTLGQVHHLKGRTPAFRSYYWLPL